MVTYPGRRIATMRTAVGKFVLQREVTHPHQRSGWAYAMSALQPALSNDGEGILLDTMIERNFCSRLRQARADNEVPYRRPWVGFVHVPYDIPRWCDYRKSARYVFRLRTWRQSVPYCTGLITLSAWMRRWLQERVDVPVLNLKHPTEVPPIRFNFRRFLANTSRRLVQVGWTFRRLCSIRELPLRRLRATVLVPHTNPRNQARFFGAVERERLLLGVPPLDQWDVDILPYQPPRQYDRLLSNNIVFVHLYSAVANNAIIECIARNTPVLVNRLPAVEEYLGAGYPLYFRTLEEAAAKAEDTDLVKETHEYLVRMPKQWLSGDYFRNSLMESDFYRSLAVE